MRIIISSSRANLYTISGDVNALLKNRRAKMLLRSSLPYSEVDGYLEIESEESIERIAHLLKLSAKYIDAEVVYDDNVSVEMQNFKNEELKFEQFSRDAINIKNNVNISANLRDFTSVLETSMLNRRLYPLQLLASYHLAFSQNGCNFSVPGAGKTSIVYGAYAYLKHQTLNPLKTVDKILIIGPLSAFAPWELEYKECFGVDPDVKRINGSLNVEQKKQYFYGNTSEITLVSYASVATIKSAIQYFLKNNRVMVVLDEAHKIKNTKGGITASSIMDIASDCSSRVVLTGTPAPNGFEDLYNLFHFIWPNRDVIKYSPSQLREMSKASTDSRIERMMDNIDPFFIRIKKQDLGIPPAIEMPPVIVPMSEGQRRLYDFIEQRFVEEASSKYSELHSSLIKARMIRLQQVATNPELLKSKLSDFAYELGEDFSAIEEEDSLAMSDLLSFYHSETPTKFVKAAEIIKDIIAEGGKVVVWAVFIKTIETLAEYLKSVGIETRLLYGSTPVASDDMTEEDESYENTREGIIKEFHKADSSFSVIIANPFAVAESISLHKVCHNAIYIERSFNCAHFIQSKDRIHRYGLKEDVVTKYYYLLSEDSIDQTIDTRLHIKENRMIALTESSDIPLFDNLGDDGDEDVKAIISDYVKRKNKQVQ